VGHVDAGGAFRVGPRSAGASPGPAAYGLGGDEPTVTDANVVLGRIDPDRFLGGEMRLDREAAAAAVNVLADRLGLGLLDAAEGIVTIANANMAGAIRSRTIQKGHDPREFTLVAFGGAGPLHAAEVADSLGVPEVLVPPFPGITSATGLLTTDLRYDQMRTVFMVEGATDGGRIDEELAELGAELRERLRADGVPDEEVRVTGGLDCRYVGQGYELRVDLPGNRFADGVFDEFRALHRREYGHAFPGPVEIVNLRVTAVGTRPKVEGVPAPPAPADGGPVGEGEGVFRLDGALAALPTRYYERAGLAAGSPVPGPAVIFQRDATILVPPEWSACAESSGNLILAR
jgi:N-methylhydantoinase A/oxoprolinase/acetone carboxylase beta subunit